MNIVKYIKKLIKKQKLLKKYNHSPQEILNLREFVGQKIYEKYYLNIIYYELRCYNRIKKL